MEVVMAENTPLLARIVTWAVIGIIAIIAIKIALGLLGIVLGFAAFLLFTVAPLLLLGWLAMKAWQAFTMA
jgi:hypothetical protein